jgi:mannose-1-phosphate guanylyltransferase
MIVLPADHVIAPAEAFQRTVRAAVSVVEADPSAFVTFGIRPTRPETGYGYIERGERSGRPRASRCTGSRSSARSRTGPRPRGSSPRAGSSGTRASSSGRARAILDALAVHRPALAAALGRIAAALGTPRRPR